MAPRVGAHSTRSERRDLAVTLAVFVAGFVTFAALLAVLWRIGHRPWLVVEVRRERDTDEHQRPSYEWLQQRAEPERERITGTPRRVIEGRKLQ